MVENNVRRLLMIFFLLKTILEDVLIWIDLWMFWKHTFSSFIIEDVTYISIAHGLSCDCLSCALLTDYLKLSSFTGPKLNYVENQDLTVVFNYSTTSKYLLLILVDMTITILCFSIAYWRSGSLSINYTIYMVLKRRYHSDCTYQKKSSPSFGLQSWLDVS